MIANVQPKTMPPRGMLHSGQAMGKLGTGSRRTSPRIEDFMKISCIHLLMLSLVMLQNSIPSAKHGSQELTMATVATFRRMSLSLNPTVILSHRSILEAVILVAYDISRNPIATDNQLKPCQSHVEPRPWSNSLYITTPVKLGIMRE
jgi:hypothetical protein